MNDDNWMDECERLLRLFLSIRRSETLDRYFTEWESEVRKLSKSREIDPFEAELRLESLTLDFRLLWKMYTHDHYAGSVLKSPVGDTIFKRPGTGESILGFAYERLADDRHLEQRCNLYRRAPEGWKADSLLFSSGMAAISTLIQCISSRLKGSEGSPLVLAMWGGYFETIDLLSELDGPGFRCRIVREQDALFAELSQGETDVLIIEPVRFDFSQEVLDLDRLCEVLRHLPPAKRTHRVILVDTSAVGHTFPMADLLSALSSAPAHTVVQVSSGTKLDQQGFEFSNVGLATIYSNERSLSGEPFGADYVRYMRGMLGSALPHADSSTLDVPFFLDYTSFSEYCHRVFAHNEMLALAIGQSTPLFGEVSHPSLRPGSERPWARSPFVLFQLPAESSQDERRLVFRVLAYEAIRRKLCFFPGTSFGFRAHRFEIYPKGREFSRSLRVQMGARSGPSLKAVIELVREISSFRDLEAIKTAYPELWADQPKIDPQK